MHMRKSECTRGRENQISAGLSTCSQIMVAGLLREKPTLNVCHTAGIRLGISAAQQAAL